MSIEERDIRVCFDCLYVEANGLDENVSDEWPGFLPEYQAVGGVLPDRGTGWLWGRQQHGDDEPEDCEGHFSWNSCYGCGSSLGGDRFCVRAVRV